MGKMAFVNKSFNLILYFLACNNGNNKYSKTKNEIPVGKKYPDFGQIVWGYTSLLLPNFTPVLIKKTLISNFLGKQILKNGMNVRRGDLLIFFKIKIIVGFLISDLID